MNEINKINEIRDMSEIDNTDNYINEPVTISGIKKSNETNSFKNSFPVGKPNKTDTNTEKTNKPDSIGILNIGQVLFTLFLLVVICVQAVNLFSANTQRTAGLTGLNVNNANIERDSGYDKISMPDSPAGQNINGSIADNFNADNAGTVFILGENGGKLAIFSPDKSTVYQTYDVYIDTLPEYDRNLLIAGIKVTSSEELHSLLEDYSS